MGKRSLIVLLMLTLISSLIPNNPIFAAEQSTEEKELIENGGFEEGQKPWLNYRNATVGVTSEEYKSGSNSLLVSGRQSTVDGPQQFITGEVQPGGTYKFSVQLKYIEGPDQKEFSFNIQNGTSWENIDIMKSETINKGEWSAIEGTYTIPEDADLSETFIFIETSYANPADPENDLMDFYVDDVSFIDITPTANLMENSGFEEGIEPWVNYGDATVAISDQEFNSGLNSLLIFDRQATNTGPKQDITGKVEVGETYEFSVKVKYTDGPDQKAFNYNIQNGPSWEYIKVMESATINKGEWGMIEGTYTVPEDADLSESFIFIETSYANPANPETDLMDFYVDDVSFGKKWSSPPEVDPGEIYDGTEAIAKVPGNNNPLISHKFGADPNVMVYDGRVYVYLTNDVYEYDENGNVIDNTYGSINTITVISSDDMVNWTDHGAIPVAGSSGEAPWATNSWAVAVGNKEIDGEDKFFLYFSNNGSGIGVLTADSPIGPWEDPIGKPLINGNTPGTAGVVWIFDPDILIDDDGQGYLYYGGGVPGGSNPNQEQAENPKTARVIKLGDDMTSIEGEAQVIDSPFHFESSGIHKNDGKYYYSYSTNFSGNRQGSDPGYADISYMVSDNPMGPFTYQGVALRNGSQFFGVGGNNHQDFFEFQGQGYVAYHAQTLAKALDTVQGYRSPHINKVEYDGNGKIIDVIADMKGVEQVAHLNPYQRTEAETIGWNAGISTEESEAPGSFLESINLNVTDINNGNWLAVSQADFGENGAKTFEANIASEVGGNIEVRLDSKDGDIIGTVEVSPTGGEQKWVLMETDVTSVSGVHDVYFMFKGESEDNLFNIDYWKFTEAEGDGNENPEEPTELTLGKQEPQEVTAGMMYTISDTNSKITMPSDLPAGTKVTVTTRDIKDTNYEGLTPSGDQLTFVFEYPEGSTTPKSDFILGLGYHSATDTERLAIYYYNEDIGEWEKRNGEIAKADQIISLNVPHFSTYGVFVENEQTPGDGDSGEGGEDGTDGENGDSGEDGENGENGEDGKDGKDVKNGKDVKGNTNGNNDLSSEEVKELPNTATNLFNYLILGLILLVIGGVIIFYVRKRKMSV